MKNQNTTMQEARNILTMVAIGVVICLTLVLIVFLVATSPEVIDNLADANAEFVDSEYVKLVVIEETNNHSILCDEYTRVMYLYINTPSGKAITPIYEADGSLKLYQGKLDT